MQRKTTIKTSQIFKVRAHISVRKRGGYFDQTFYKETIVLANIQRAKTIYYKYLDEVKFDLQLTPDKKIARCELFIPHIYEDGTIAHWPDNNQYIEIFKHQ